MAVRTINENPTIADTVVIPIRTPDEDGCFLADPFKVSTVTIYYMSRNFNNPSNIEFEEEAVDPELVAEFEDAKQLACEVPIQFNIDKAEILKQELDENTRKFTTTFTEAVTADTFGTEDFPAWLSTNTENAILTHVTEDDDGNTIYGHFELNWNPIGQREGDYIVCWSWMPLAAGDTLSAHLKFFLKGATQLTTVIPTHQTNPEKYPTLLDRYTANTHKTPLSQNDLTPPIIKGFNLAVGDGFELLETLSNQLFDIIDANATPENFLPLLGNLFNLRLRSDDPTLWRRQIKTALPLYKKKGTHGGLEQALDQSGMKLLGFTKLWQVISPYTFQEIFDVTEDGQSTFTLSQVIVLPLDTSNFEIYYRAVDDDEYTQLNSDYVTFSNSGGVTTMTWVGSNLSINPITLSTGDTVRVLYEVVEVPASEQTREDLIRSLPLMDQRDERNQDVPLKNWNVRAIEETDPLFDLAIPTRHPYRDPVVWGWVRTEIAYSENIYNMEEYNGSKRQSMIPCDIDKDFLDDCTFCQGSKFNIDVEIDDLSNDRILEALDVVEEFVPFHSQIHTISFSGATEDLQLSPVETLEALVLYSQEDITISGNGANLIFNRVMLTKDQIERDMLADSTKVVSSASGTTYNNEIVLFSPDANLGKEAISDSTNLLEVLSPSPNSGEYTLTDIDGHYAVVSGGDTVSEPLLQSNFTFRISNEIFTYSSTNITQDNQFFLEDTEVEFSDLGVKSVFDVNNDPDYTGGAWQINIPAFSDTYDILNVLPDGTLELDDPSGTLPASTTSGITYSLLTDTSTSVTSSTTGKVIVIDRAKVDVSGLSGPGGSLDDVRNLLKTGDYLLLSGIQYKIVGFVTGQTHEFYIGDYALGDMAGVSTKLLRRIVDNQIGNFAYRGLTLQTAIDYEASLGILNGANAPTDENLVLEDNRFKENFLVLVNPSTDMIYYTIDEIDGTTVTLNGQHQDWTTLSSGGTSITFDIYRFTKLPASIPERTEPDVPGHDFDFLDRRGNVIIDSETESAMPMSLRAASLNAAKDDQVVDSVQHTENISYNIETADGNTHKGEL